MVRRDVLGYAVGLPCADRGAPSGLPFVMPATPSHSDGQSRVSGATPHELYFYA